MLAASKALQFSSGTKSGIELLEPTSQPLPGASTAAFSPTSAAIASGVPAHKLSSASPSDFLAGNILFNSRLVEHARVNHQGGLPALSNNPAEMSESCALCVQGSDK